MWEAPPSASGGSATGSTKAAGSDSSLSPSPQQTPPHHLRAVRALLITSSETFLTPPVSSFLTPLLLCLLQNSTVGNVNSSAVSYSIKDNPMMQHYAAVYASSMVVMLLFKVIRGIAFVKVCNVQQGAPLPALSGCLC